METAADLRAEVARRNVKVYALAALVPMHPGRLGQVLRGRLPLTPELAERISKALKGGPEPRGGCRR